MRTAAGSCGTSPVAINDLGAIVGDHNDASRVQRRFLRAACDITTFDPLGSQYTSPQGINNEGPVVGPYVDAAGDTHGFLRSVHGDFAVIDDPNPGGSPLNTVIRAINDQGAMVATLPT